VAHPDDEALWLSSVVASAGRVVFCFGAVFERPQLSKLRPDLQPTDHLEGAFVLR
jgi:hypothetical protein